MKAARDRARVAVVDDKTPDGDLEALKPGRHPRHPAYLATGGVNDPM